MGCCRKIDVCNIVCKKIQKKALFCNYFNIIWDIFRKILAGKRGQKNGVDHLFCIFLNIFAIPVKRQNIFAPYKGRGF
jgi:hypothetical protein